MAVSSKITSDNSSTGAPCNQAPPHVGPQEANLACRSNEELPSSSFEEVYTKLSSFVCSWLGSTDVQPHLRQSDESSAPLRASSGSHITCCASLVQLAPRIASVVTHTFHAVLQPSQG